MLILIFGMIVLKRSKSTSAKLFHSIDFVHNAEIWYCFLNLNNVSKLIGSPKFPRSKVSLLTHSTRADYLRYVFMILKELCY